MNDISFEKSLYKIGEIYKKHSFEDVATSLFISSLWLPNIASPVSHQFLIAILASFKQSEFSKELNINNYQDFSSFLSEIYALLPPFIALEDFVPELDWGEVKFFHEDRNYKIFYGNEIGHVYDWLIQYQMIYLPYDEQYLDCSGFSPSQELQQCLQLQDTIISQITTQPSIGDESTINAGHIEVPNLDFWKEVSAFYAELIRRPINYSAFLEKFSKPTGFFELGSLDEGIFGNLVMSGEIVPTFFLEHDKKYYPILPRRYLGIFIDEWSNIYQAYHQNVTGNDLPCHLRIGAKLHKYIKARVRSDSLFPLCSAVTESGAADEIPFSTAFISGKRLVLIYVTEPAYDGKKTSEEINAVLPKLKTALELMREQPTTLGLPLENKIAKFGNVNNGSILEPALFIVIPLVATKHLSLQFSEGPLGDVTFLDQFVGFIDELDSADMVDAFLDYLEEYKSRINSPILGLLDFFGSFKSSYGVLEEGANTFDFISLYPHWGSNLRYETLQKFWQLYPDAHYFDHPRSWRIKQETKSRLRLEARGYFGSALHCEVGLTHIFISAPFMEIPYEQAEITNLLMECLEDSLSRHAALISSHAFFKWHEQLKILCYPLSLVRGVDKFKHLRHMVPDEFWCSDSGVIKDGIDGIRIVFDDKKLVQALSKINDRSIEVNFLLEVLGQIDFLEPDDIIKKIKGKISKTKKQKPRFKVSQEENPATFPAYINSHVPKNPDFKRARKRIAELAKQEGLTEGSYSQGDAKQMINTLILTIVNEINKEASTYNFKASIIYLITRIDALNYDYEMSRLRIDNSLEHDVDYDRESAFADKHSSFILMHRNYRYLIEKFVQLQPEGDAVLNHDKFRYLIAMIDWFHVFRAASDSMHYEIHTAGLKVNDQFVVEVIYEDIFDEQQKIFEKEEAALRIGTIGVPDDKVSNSKSFDQLLEEMDASFLTDLQFSFRNMLSILKILSYWPQFQQTADENTYYSASCDEITKAGEKNIENVEHREIGHVLDFLTLKSHDVLRILNQEVPCEDLPIWEYKKRYSRYNIRPLIKINDKYFWGSYSAMKAGVIWLGALSAGSLPTDLKCSNINSVISNEKKRIEKSLEVKTHEIVKRYTSFVDANVQLHKRDKKGNHPSRLGDYDVLAYYQNKNVILNIECKDILHAHCLKDAKTLRETIFGKAGKNRGHFDQIDKRQSYLKEHLDKVAEILKWELDKSQPPKIIPIYLSRNSYWWTKFPPYEVESFFVRVDMLSDYLNEL